MIHQLLRIEDFRSRQMLITKRSLINVAFNSAHSLKHTFGFSHEYNDVAYEFKALVIINIKSSDN
jgi:hypothetical protein